MTTEQSNRSKLEAKFGKGRYSVRIDSGEVYVLTSEWKYFGHIDNPALI